MNCTYYVRKDVYTDSTCEMQTVYGIDAINSSAEIIRSLPNIFLSEDQAQDTVDLFNKESLSVHHFEDAVNDALAELYGIF